jgi:hypothetical protein
MKTLRPRNWPSSVGAEPVAEDVAGEDSGEGWGLLMIDFQDKH